MEDKPLTKDEIIRYSGNFPEMDNNELVKANNQALRDTRKTNNRYATQFFLIVVVMAVAYVFLKYHTLGDFLGFFGSHVILLEQSDLPINLRHSKQEKLLVADTSQ